MRVVNRPFPADLVICCSLIFSLTHLFADLPSFLLFDNFELEKKIWNDGQKMYSQLKWSESTVFLWIPFSSMYIFLTTKGYEQILFEVPCAFYDLLWKHFLQFNLIWGVVSALCDFKKMRTNISIINTHILDSIGTL